MMKMRKVITLKRDLVLEREFYLNDFFARDMFLEFCKSEKVYKFIEIKTEYKDGIKRNVSFNMRDTIEDNKIHTTISLFTYDSKLIKMLHFLRSKGFIIKVVRSDDGETIKSVYVNFIS